MSKNQMYMQKFQATTKSLKEVRKFFSSIAKHLPIHQDLFDQMVLAVDEAATNIIKHSLGLNDKKLFTIEIEVEENSISIRLMDNGKPFDPQKIPVPDIEESIHKKKRGGLGIYLMRQIMDSVNYYQRDSSNVTELIKYF